MSGQRPDLGTQRAPRTISRRMPVPPEEGGFGFMRLM